MNNKLLLLFCTLFISISHAQSESDILYITMLQKVGTKANLKERRIYLDSIIQKAKNEKQYKYLFASYHMHALLQENENTLKYCDSIINLSKLYKYEDEFYPKDAYQIKGDFFFTRKDYNRALDSYLAVHDYAEKYNDTKLLFDSNLNIGFLKRKTGDYKSALKLYKQNLLLLKEKEKLDSVAYLNCIRSIANIYNDMALPDSSMIYNKLGINTAAAFKKTKFRNHFSLNCGVSLYLQNKYSEAIDSIEKYIPYFKKNDPNKGNLSFAYYYCGEAYNKLNNTPKAIAYFKKVDTIFREKGNLFPLIRETYEHLIQYYKKRKDLNSHLTYVNQLIRLDSILHNEEIYLNKGLITKYDIPKLKSEKEDIIKQMNASETKSFSIIIIISVSLLVIIILLCYQIKLKKEYKNKFLEIINKPKKLITEKKIENSDDKIVETTSINIPQKIIDDVLEALDSFEKKHQYINKDITLSSLAKKVGSNTNYLSKIINHFKEKSFSNYLNDLRIEYAIEKLKQDTIFRKYTIKAIAEEVGFKNSESFSKAFYKLKGIKPSYFLKELIKISE
ncbi:helix-turn-helix domain-containing protein [Tenacibaculum amylolyticum]|uniref:helix-turn-helix domain-containing protein n=1 Tax=Tenacibaculum amylolyticum TaxID=104269 RepID=UPI003892DA48